MIKCFQNEQLFKGIPANADALSSSSGQGLYGRWLPAEEFTGCIVHASLSGADHTDAVLKLQSCDFATPSDAHAVDVPSATVTLNANKDFTFTVNMQQLLTRWVRLNYTHGTNTVGALDAYISLKG